MYDLKKWMAGAALLSCLVGTALFAGHHSHHGRGYDRVERKYTTKNYYYTGAAPGPYYGYPISYPAYYYSYPYYDSQPYDNHYTYPSYDTRPGVGLYLQLGR
ncbi:MAG: hypothetical protein LW832_05960 [Parachlamydia sp.]|jgi:hypothetical protein|nr:hypothetical protein [Parachlamydia sp.]